MTHRNSSPDIVRSILAVLFICILITASLWILRPFLTALVWATMIVVTTWPVMLGVQKRLGGKRGPAVLVMVVGLLMVFIIPFSAAIISIIDRSDEIVAGAKALSTFSPPPAPEWLRGIPVIGAKVSGHWDYLATSGKAELAARLTPYLEKIASWLIARAGSAMIVMVQFLLTVIISAVLYATGEKAARGFRLFAARLGGQSGENAVILAAKAVRGVALGVVVTAVIQSLLGGVGLAAAGVPAAALLTAAMFILCIAQVGPSPVLIPAVIWLFSTDQTIWGWIMIFWTLAIITMDNLIRPLLIKKGADLPLLLIFAGVIGGLIAFGVIGLFIGPVMLAVTYTLLEAWVAGSDHEHQDA